MVVEIDGVAGAWRSGPQRLVFPGHRFAMPQLSYPGPCLFGTVSQRREW